MMYNSQRQSRASQSSSNHRKYHKLSNLPSNLSEQLFSKYLMKQGYGKTFKMFQKQKQNRHKPTKSNIDRLLQEILRIYDAQDGKDKFRLFEIVQQIRKIWKKDDMEIIKIEFLMHVWLVSLDDTQNVRNKLRDFITLYGGKLTQVSSLLPYFALPYMSNPQTHPFIQRIYTKQWRQNLREIIIQTLTQAPQTPLVKAQANSQNHEWLKIIKDLIDICQSLGQNLHPLSPKHQQMLHRVKMYQNVITENNGQYSSDALSGTSQSVQPSELNLLYVNNISNVYAKMRPSLAQMQNPQQIIQPQVLDDRNISMIKKSTQREIIDQMGGLDQQQPQIALNFKKIKDDIQKQLLSDQETAMLFYSLNYRIATTKSLSIKKKLINQYINNDILSIRSQKLSEKIFEIEGLKLCYRLCLLAAGRKYLCSNNKFISKICDILQENKRIYLDYVNGEQEQQECQYVEEKLTLIFGIIQKVSLNAQIFTLLANQHKNMIESIVVDFLPMFSLLSKKILTYILALLMNFVSHQSGNQLCSSNFYIEYPNKSLLHSSHKKRTPESFIKQQDSTISLMQTIIIIWRDIFMLNPKSNMNEQQQEDNQLIQSLLFSIIYLLLLLPINCSIAYSLKFDQELQMFVQLKKEEYYKRVVGKIMKRLKGKGEGKGKEGKVGAGSQRNNINLDYGYMESDIFGDMSESKLVETEEDDEDEDQELILDQNVGQDDQQYIWVGSRVIYKDPENLAKWDNQFLNEFYQKSSQQKKSPQQLPHTRPRPRARLPTHQNIKPNSKANNSPKKSKKQQSAHIHENKSSPLQQINNKAPTSHPQNYSCIYDPNKYRKWRQLTHI